MQCILINRFILNLRRAGTESNQLGTSAIDPARSFSLHFRLPTVATVIGDMDQPLEHGAMTDEGDDSWENESGPTEEVALVTEHRDSTSVA